MDSVAEKRYILAACFRIVWRLYLISFTVNGALWELREGAEI